MHFITWGFVEFGSTDLVVREFSLCLGAAASERHMIPQFALWGGGGGGVACLDIRAGNLEVERPSRWAFGCMCFHKGKVDLKCIWKHVFVRVLSGRWGRWFAETGLVWRIPFAIGQVLCVASDGLYSS